ncbi:MAG: leucine-rich repeat domain-containing protein [Ktedonobacteraceae bacterium]
MSSVSPGLFFAASIRPSLVAVTTSVDWLSTHNYHCSTRALPAEMGNLTSLQRLYVAYNQLSSLPAQVGNLSSLQVLFLQNNNLSTLPVEIGKLTLLQELQLYDNPLQTPPLEIIKQGIPAILAYLRTL